MWEEHLSPVHVAINPKAASKMMHVEFGNKPLSDPLTQQWLRKVIRNDNQSDVTIYINMDADDLLNLKYMIPRLSLPDQVQLGQSLNFSWEGIEVNKLPRKFRLLSVNDDSYITDMSKLKEVESYVVPSVSGEMSIPPTKLAKPGQYYLDVTEGSRTNTRLFGFIVVAPDTPGEFIFLLQSVPNLTLYWTAPNNFSIEISTRKLALEYKLLGKGNDYEHYYN